jgi:hypothetical protein
MQSPGESRGFLLVGNIEMTDDGSALRRPKKRPGDGPAGLLA